MAVAAQRNDHGAVGNDFASPPPVGPAQRLVLFVGALYVVAVGLLFASRLREFADETDNLLGGLLIVRGARLYVDYFSNHMPLAYYVAALPALLGAQSLEQFRLFTDLLLIGATLAVVVTFRASLPLTTLATWATITLFAHTLQWGEMLVAGTLAGYGVFAAGLLFFTMPGLRFTPRQIVGLSLAVFVAIQSELVAVFPLFVLVGCFVYIHLIKRRDIRFSSMVLAAVIAPHLAVFIGLWLVGALPDFVYDAYQFNNIYYAQFLMNPSVVGMLHDWEAQYRTYLFMSLAEPLGVQALLVLVNFAAAVVVFRTRGLAIALLFYLFISLTHVRNEAAYYLCSYFSLALLLTYALRSSAVPLRVAVALVAAAFVVEVGATYDLRRQPIDRPDVPLVQALTSPGERIFVAPYDPYVYLASGRMPASRFPFYFPWQALDPRSESTLIEDLRVQQPPVVVLHGEELVNGQWRLAEYGARVYGFLIGEGYAPLEAGPSPLNDVLVRADRLVTAREHVLTHP